MNPFLQATLCDPKSHMWNALAVAAALGHVPIVEYLIAVDKLCSYLWSSVPSLNDIFTQAAIRTQIQVLHVLLDQGAKYMKLDERDSGGFTPLMYVAQLGYMDLAEKLIGMGVGLLIRNHEGLTALSLARDKSMVKLLARAGATLLDQPYLLD